MTDTTTATTPPAAKPFTEADVQRYAEFIAGHPDAAVDPRHLAATRAILDALASDGRLLPAAPVETTTEWGVWWHGDDPDGIVMSDQHMSNRQWAERIGVARIGQYGIKSYTVRCCEHRKFADGSVWISGWVKAEPEAPVDRSSVNLAVAEVKP